MAIRALQNFFKTTISVACSSAVGNIYVLTLPTTTNGYLVINPKDTSKREIIEYNATGTDANGNYVYANARGVGGTTAQAHDINEPIRMNFTAQHWEELLKKDVTDSNFDAGNKKIKNVVNPTSNQDACTKLYADNLAIAGAPDASDVTKGIAKLSVAPAVPTNPIAIGSNDPQLTNIPSTGQKAALAGSAGTPSDTNRYLTQEDTTFVKTSGDQTIAGVKTFSSIPVLPASDPTTDNQAARKAYIDSKINNLALQQRIPIRATGVNFSSYTRMTSTIDGKELFIISSTDANTDIKIVRFYRDTNLYFLTHEITITAVFASSMVSCAVIGNYLYIHIYVGGSNYLRRYNKADLTNETIFTFSGTLPNYGMAATTNGTDLFLATTTADTLRKYSLSGTVATFVSDVVFTSIGNYYNGGLIYNGANIYSTVGDITSDIKKYAITGGAILATYNNATLLKSYTNQTNKRVFMVNSEFIGMGSAFQEYNGASYIDTLLLNPLTKTINFI